MLEAEVVTASGEILMANAGQHTDLFCITASAARPRPPSTA
jgi:hypothetical protein